jgi:hypothetical protein
MVSAVLRPRLDPTACVSVSRSIVEHVQRVTAVVSPYPYFAFAFEDSWATEACHTLICVQEPRLL